MAFPGFTIERGEGPVIAAAIHEGNEVRPEVGELLELSPEERRREEDPYTAQWTIVAPTRVVVWKSRFEADLNRPRRGAIYRSPDEAWGLQVWKEDPPPELVAESLHFYDTFYDDVRELLEEVEREHGRFVVLDLHSYNHRREGPSGPMADPALNPDVNVGTGSLDRSRWGDLADSFIQAMREGKEDGRPLDVRENVRFQGGWFSRWINDTFPGSGCCLTVNVKKFYMDEWSGVADPGRIRDVRKALADSVPRLVDTLGP